MNDLRQSTANRRPETGYELRDMLKYAEVRLRDAERDAAYLFDADPDTTARLG